ncbi:RRBP1-like protein, partial [Mya arenaria]
RQNTITKTNGRQNIITKAKGRQNIISNTKGRQNIISNTKGRQNLITKTTGRQNIITKPKGRQNIITKAKGRQNIISNTKGRQNIITNTNGRQNIITKTKGRQNIITKTKGRQNIITKTKGRQNIITNTNGRQNIIFNTKGRQNIISYTNALSSGQIKEDGLINQGSNKHVVLNKKHQSTDDSCEDCGNAKDKSADIAANATSREGHKKPFLKLHQVKIEINDDDNEEDKIIDLNEKHPHEDTDMDQVIDDIEFDEKLETNEETNAGLKEVSKVEPNEKTKSGPNEKLGDGLKMISEARQNENSKARPNEKSEARPKEKSESRPKENSEAIPNENTEAIPKEKSESRPKEKSESRPKEKSESRPNKKSEARPNEKSEARPKEKSEARSNEKSNSKSNKNHRNKPKNRKLKLETKSYRTKHVQTTNEKTSPGTTKGNAAKPQSNVPIVKTDKDTKKGNTSEIDKFLTLVDNYYKDKSKSLDQSDSTHDTKNGEVHSSNSSSKPKTNTHLEIERVSKDGTSVKNDKKGVTGVQDNQKKKETKAEKPETFVDTVEEDDDFYMVKEDTRFIESQENEQTNKADDRETNKQNIGSQEKRHREDEDKKKHSPKVSSHPIPKSKQNIGHSKPGEKSQIKEKTSKVHKDIVSEIDKTKLNTTFNTGNGKFATDDLFPRDTDDTGEVKADVDVIIPEKADDRWSREGLDAVAGVARLERKLHPTVDAPVRDITLSMQRLLVRLQGLVGTVVPVVLESSLLTKQIYRRAHERRRPNQFRYDSSPVADLRYRSRKNYDMMYDKFLRLRQEVVSGIPVRALYDLGRRANQTIRRLTIERPLRQQAYRVNQKRFLADVPAFQGRGMSLWPELTRVLDKIRVLIEGSGDISEPIYSNETTGLLLTDDGEIIDDKIDGDFTFIDGDLEEDGHEVDKVVDTSEESKIPQPEMIKPKPTKHAEHVTTAPPEVTTQKQIMTSSPKDDVTTIKTVVTKATTEKKTTTEEASVLDIFSFWNDAPAGHPYMTNEPSTLIPTVASNAREIARLVRVRPDPCGTLERYDLHIRGNITSLRDKIERARLLAASMQGSVEIFLKSGRPSVTQTLNGDDTSVSADTSLQTDSWYTLLIERFANTHTLSLTNTSGSSARLSVKGTQPFLLQDTARPTHVTIGGEETAGGCIGGLTVNGRVTSLGEGLSRSCPSNMVFQDPDLSVLLDGGGYGRYSLDRHRSIRELEVTFTPLSDGAVFSLGSRYLRTKMAAIVSAGRLHVYLEQNTMKTSLATKHKILGEKLTLSECVSFTSSSRPLEMSDVEDGDRVFLSVHADALGQVLEYNKTGKVSIAVILGADGEVTMTESLNKEESKRTFDSDNIYHTISVMDSPDDKEVKVTVARKTFEFSYKENGGGGGGWGWGGKEEDAEDDVEEEDEEAGYDITLGGNPDKPFVGDLLELIIGDTGTNPDKTPCMWIRKKSSGPYFRETCPDKTPCM